MVRIIRKIKYEEQHEISTTSIDTVLKDLKQIEKKIEKAGSRYLGVKNAKKFQVDIAKTRANLIGAIKP